MDFSFLSHTQFHDAVDTLTSSTKETPYGTATCLWAGDALCGMGWGEPQAVLQDLTQFLGRDSTPQAKTDDPTKALLVGTPFQHRVWKALLEIPAGDRVTYRDIAHKVGNPKAVRAVGSAIGRNTISFHVPCHRVIRTDGQLGGYRWGLAVKEKILASERVS